MPCLHNFNKPALFETIYSFTCSIQVRFVGGNGVHLKLHKFKGAHYQGRRKGCECRVGGGWLVGYIRNKLFA